MIQEIIISGDSAVPIKPLIQSAIHSELRLLELSIQRTNENLKIFEEKYKINSYQFKHDFETGKIEESLDFIEWLGEIKTLDILNSQKKALQQVDIVDY